jgi:hypothetical protein
VREHLVDPAAARTALAFGAVIEAHHPTASCQPFPSQTDDSSGSLNKTFIHLFPETPPVTRFDSAGSFRVSLVRGADPAKVVRRYTDFPGVARVAEAHA